MRYLVIVPLGVVIALVVNAYLSPARLVAPPEEVLSQTVRQTPASPTPKQLKRAPSVASVKQGSVEVVQSLHTKEASSFPDAERALSWPADVPEFALPPHETDPEILESLELALEGPVERTELRWSESLTGDWREELALSHAESGIPEEHTEVVIQQLEYLLSKSETEPN